MTNPKLEIFFQENNTNETSFRTSWDAMNPVLSGEDINLKNMIYQHKSQINFI